MNKRTMLYLLVILILGALTRFMYLDVVPANLQPDSVDTIRIYLEHRYRQDFSPLSTNWNGSHIINQLMIAVPWELAGEPFWAVSLGPALISIVSLIAFYFLVTCWTKNPSLAVILTLLLMVDPWFLNFSRSGWENIANCLGVILLLLSLQLPTKQSKLQYTLLFLVTVISPYLYHPGKIIALISFTVLIVLVVIKKIKLTQKVILLFFTIVVTGMCLIPIWLVDSATQWVRINTVSIFNTSNVTTAMISSLRNNFLGFMTFQPAQWSIGINSRYIPLDSWVLHPVIVLLFMFGTLYLLRKKWWLILIGILLIFPVNILSQNTPDAARTVHALPYIYFVSAFGLNLFNSLLDRLVRFSQKKLQIIKVVKLGSVSLGVMMLLFLQLTHYHNWISHPLTLKTREPAIYIYEYDQWLGDAKKQIELTGKTLSIYEWRELESVIQLN